MDILIGGGGFIGTNIQEVLQDKYFIIIDKDFKNIVNTKNDYIKLDFLNSANFQTIQNFIEDIKNKKFTKPSLLQKLDLDKLNIHILAANLGVNKVIKDSEYLQNEITLINNLIEFLNQILSYKVYNQINIFYYSTSEVYGDIEYMSEDGPQKLSSIEVNFSRNRYAVSKIYGEYMLKEIIDNWKNQVDTDLNLLIIRPFNVIGKYQDISFLIPKMIYDAVTQNKIFVYGDGSQKRTFIDVREFVLALDKIQQEINTGIKIPLVMNFGNIQNNYSVFEIATMLQSLLKDKGINAEIEFTDVDSSLIGAKNRIPNVNRFFKYYKPMYKFKDTLEWIIDWEIDYIKNYLTEG